MSEQPAEREAIELPANGDLAFGALMDALAPEDGAETGAGEGTPAGAGDAGGAPAAPASTEPAGRSDAAAGSTAAAADAGASADPAGEQGSDAGGADGGVQEPGRGAAGDPGVPDFSEVAAQLGGLNAAIEESTLRGYQQQAFTAVREGYPKYIEALEKHPRLLVGTEVPAIGREGTETLKDTNDAREWQEAVKSILTQEIQARAETQMSESRDYLETIHASVDLFKNNADLIPGTAGFNRELADKFAELAKPYEVRVDGKLTGYSIPVQPLVENLRAQLAAAQPPSNPAPAAGTPAQTRPPETVEPPQAGIPSKAGSAAEREDFSTLFGTIGMPNLQI